MDSQHSSADGHAWKIREWLFLILRFAITHAHSDRIAIHRFADELDSIGGDGPSSGSHFFLRTSNEICSAIAETGDSRNTVLRKHASRIDDNRLRQAFEAAVDLREPPASSQTGKAKLPKREDLWRGLSSRAG